jgi:hypothetical protein
MHQGYGSFVANRGHDESTIAFETPLVDRFFYHLKDLRTWHAMLDSLPNKATFELHYNHCMDYMLLGSHIRPLFVAVIVWPSE